MCRRLVGVLTIFLFAAMPAVGKNVAKMLIIDTLITPVSAISISINANRDSALAVSFSKFDSVCRGYFLRDTILNIVLNSTPSLSITLDGDSKTDILSIQLDDSGGYLKIPDFFNTNADTIFISKYQVFHNCFPDTTKATRTWFRKYANDSLRPLKRLRSDKKKDIVHTGKNCSIEYPSTMELLVNSQRYTLPLIKKDFSVPMHYHGYSKRNSKPKGERRLSRRISRGKSHIYWHGKVFTTEYRLAATLQLDQ